ncbi:MAG TPA: tRNA pseudouridine(55) synthase TruB [Burkholderiaceae bacterium]|nr:tRNA pseudouridine(55) synthase TruB [Burkholderiaceae bacterium]
MQLVPATPATPRPARQPKRAVHGVLLLDKPLGLSSNDALQRVRRLLRAEKAGHAGTLDPLATGLLPLCFGAATKFSQLGLEADKGYRAVLKLGVTTTTADAEGEVLQRRAVDVTAAAVEAAANRFIGPIEQVPPMHSALKRDGKALYEYARAGVEIVREPRRVTIHRIDVIDWQADRLEIDVRCSKGTYVRTLAEDIGEALGCGAHLAALRRTTSGALSVEQAVPLTVLQDLSPEEIDARLLPVDTLVADRPALRLDAEEAGRFLSGMRRRLKNQPDDELVRVYGPQPAAFLGTARVRAGELIPLRLLSPLEVEAVLQSRTPR